MNFVSWCETVPEEITGDRAWRVKAYQLALFAADIAWTDLGPLMADRRTLALSDQLYRIYRIGQRKHRRRLLEKLAP